MKLSDILSTLDSFNVVIHILNESELHNKNYCYAVVIPTDKLAYYRGAKSSSEPKETGVYIIDCDLIDFYKANKAKNLEGTVQIEKTINENTNIFDGERPLAFSLFSILHEIGHITHFQNAKMSYEEYYNAYQKDWDDIYKDYLFMYRFYGTTQERLKAVNVLFGEKYRNHAFESYADNFALEHFEKCMQKLRCMR